MLFYHTNLGATSPSFLQDTHLRLDLLIGPPIHPSPHPLISPPLCLPIHPLFMEHLLCAYIALSTGELSLARAVRVPAKDLDWGDACEDKASVAPWVQALKS